jgi:NADPH:quinone reductase-like Zn-dependent oxidoreductase
MGVFLPERERIQSAMRFLVAQTAAGQLRTQVAAVLPLSKIAAAHRMLEPGRVAWAIVLDPRR